jgi:starvation-inducible DNA-binding protein
MKKSYIEDKIPGVNTDQMGTVVTHLSQILACLRAQYLSYQTSHWQVTGPSYYGDHLLFQRLYESVTAEIDTLAEKIVGYFGSGAVDLNSQMQLMFGYTQSWSTVESHHTRGLTSELDLQNLLKDAYACIKDSGTMTLGMDDWLMATSNAHESNEFLLQQALAGAGGMSMKKSAKSLVKPVAPTAVDDFYKNPEKREVREFAETGAVTNDPAVASKASQKKNLDLPKKQTVSDAKDAPPTPKEIERQPGGKSMSTLNRFVVESEDPNASKAVKMNKPLMAAWIREIEGN